MYLKLYLALRMNAFLTNIFFKFEIAQNKTKGLLWSIFWNFFFTSCMQKTVL